MSGHYYFVEKLKIVEKRLCKLNTSYMVKYHIPLNYPRILLVGKKYSETPSISTLPAVHGWESQVEN